MIRETIKIRDSKGNVIGEQIKYPTPRERRGIERFKKLVEQDLKNPLPPFPKHLQEKMQSSFDAGLAETERMIAKEKKIKEANE